MKNRIQVFGLGLALILAALPAMAQEKEPAPLPDEWGRIEKAVDLSLDQVQAIRAELDARKAAVTEWEKANKDAFETLKKEAKAAQEAQNADALRALEERAKPYMTQRDAIKTNSEARLNAVLRPEQKATWAAVGRYEKDFRQLLQQPGVTDEQKTRLAEGFKDFTRALGQWELEKSAQFDALTARNLANSQARHAQEQGEAVTQDQLTALRKEHTDISNGLNALRAEREKVTDEGVAKLFAILTPEQVAATKASALLGDLANKLRKMNVTPEQMAAVKTLCETEAKAMPGMTSKDISQARERLQKAVFAQVLTDEQRAQAQGKTPAEPAKTPAPATP